MKKVLWVATIVALLASVVSAQEYGPVRDVLMKKNWEPITVDEATTIVNHPHAAFLLGGKHFSKICEEMGGNNIFAIYNGLEKPWYNKDGNLTEEAEQSTKFFPIVSKDVFRGEKSYPIVCKKDEMQIFKVAKSYSEYKDSIGIEWYSARYTFSHQPEKQTQFTPDKLHLTADQNDIKTVIAKRVAKLKSQYIHTVGNLQYVGTYNAQDRGCDLVSVLEKPLNGSTITSNYRVCKNNVAQLGATMPSPKFSAKMEVGIVATARICQQSGASSSGFDNYIIACKALRDKDKCSVEVSILNEQDQLVDKRIMNGCN